MNRILHSLFILASLSAQSQVTFEKTYLTSSHDHFRKAFALKDSSLVLAGYADNGHSYVIRTNKYGDTIWTRAYYPLNTIHHHIFSACRSSDDAIMITGGAAISQNSVGLSLGKISKSGQLLWFRAIAFTNTVSSVKTLHHISLCADKGFLLTGYEDLTGSTAYAATLRKTDSLGHVQWSVVLSTGGSLFAYSAVELDNKDVVVAGSETASGLTRAILFKVDSTGSFKWLKRYGNSNSQEFLSITDGKNGYLYAAGMRPPGALVVKTDTGGNFAIARYFSITGTYSHFASVVKSRGHLLLTGATVTNTTSDAIIVKTDMQCDSVFTRRFITTEHEYGASGEESPLGGYFIGGDRISTGTAGNFFALVTDTMGRTSCTWSPGKMTVTSFSMPPSPTPYTVTAAGGDFTASLDPATSICTVQTNCAPCIPPAAPVDITPANKKFICTPQSTTLSVSSAGSVNWYLSSSSPSIASGSTLPTQSLSPGTYTYYASATTCTISTKTAVTFTVSGCTYLDEQMERGTLSIFPNPNNGAFQLFSDNPLDGSVFLRNTLGQVVFAQKVNGNTIEIKTNELKKGIYFLVLVRESTFISRGKIIVEN